MDALTLEIFAQYGVLAAGWGIAWLLWGQLKAERKDRDDERRKHGEEKTELLREGFTHMAATNTVLEIIKDRLPGRPA